MSSMRVRAEVTDCCLRKADKVQNMDSILELDRPWRPSSPTTLFIKGLAEEHIVFE